MWEDFFVCLAISLTFREIRLPCNDGLPARVGFDIVGGTPPYLVEGNCSELTYGLATCWMGHGSRMVVRDALNGTAELLLPKHEFLSGQLSWYYLHQRYLLVTAEPLGGSPPYSFEWSDRSRNNQAIVLIGTKAHVRMIDSNKCALTLQVSEHDDVECPSIGACTRLPILYAVTCLKNLSMLSDPPPRSLCATKAAVVLAQKLIERPYHDHGPAFIALRLAASSSLEGAEAMSSAFFDALIIRQILQYDETLLSLFNLHVKGHISYAELLSKSVAYMLGLRAAHVPDVDTLIVSPHGFENEPVFAPQLVYGSRKVACLVTAPGVFRSSLVHPLVLPISLECDVDLVVLYVEAVLFLLKPRWVFPGDSAGILVLGKLNPQEAYPPVLLSKLAPSNAPFSPEGIIVSEDDGLTQIAMDLERAQAALEVLGGSAFLKREFSDAGRGVFLANKDNLEEMALKTMRRMAGPESMDLSIKVRLFLQKRIKASKGAAPIKGFRFYARNGTLVAAHTSVVKERVPGTALEYTTIRDEQVEELSRSYIKAIDYDGFGGLWWLFDEQEQKHYLFDFNARFERHMCIAAVLPDHERHLDPCVYFALELEAPFVPVPAGHCYTDPIRLSAASKISNAKWNLRQDDQELMAWLKREKGIEPPMV